jgi:hypothetical protein
MHRAAQALHEQADVQVVSLVSVAFTLNHVYVMKSASTSARPSVHCCCHSPFHKDPYSSVMTTSVGSN